MIVVLVLKSLKEIVMKQLSRFKVIQNTLVYGDYKISLTPQPKFVVCYQGREIFSSDEKDTLEDVIEVIS